MDQLLVLAQHASIPDILGSQCLLQQTDPSSEVIALGGSNDEQLVITKGFKHLLFVVEEPRISHHCHGSEVLKYRFLLRGPDRFIIRLLLDFPESPKQIVSALQSDTMVVAQDRRLHFAS